ncbi:LacI family DNA-binding transcriptional regulator [Tritonibacter litoralis]|uniref:LacI family DNA-binding transcriptional regulator n=1 Tax=Tritonibacter litoralis TaxID=2662264 RepID=UPI0031B58870
MTRQDKINQSGVAARRVTIADLSRELGITKGTVSRALNGYTDISASTRQRVERAAERLGYRPLTQAQAIRTGRSQSIGLVIETGNHDAHRPFLAEFLAGASSAAAAEGWTLTVSTADTPDQVLQRMQQLVQDRKADGFILPRTLSDDPRVAHLRAHDVPFVLFGRVADPTGCAWFDFKGGVAIRDAVHRLHAAGHRRIGYIGSTPEYHYEKLRLAGFRRGLSDLGLAEEPALMCENAVIRSQGAEAARQFLCQPDRPTALIYAVDDAALGAWDAAHEAGLAIGHDLSIVSYDGTKEGAAARPSLASYAVDNRYAGERLAHLLIRRVRGEAPEALREECDVPFRPGGSFGPVRGPTGGNPSGRMP